MNTSETTTTVRPRRSVRMRNAMVATVLISGTLLGSIAAASPAQAAGACISNVYRQGSKGVCVGYLQKLLIYSGQRISVDSDFGPATGQAVKNFQMSKWWLDKDQVVGPMTWGALCTVGRESNIKDARNVARWAGC